MNNLQNPGFGAALESKEITFYVKTVQPPKKGKIVENLISNDFLKFKI